jgi:hypothetical protein
MRQAALAGWYRTGADVVAVIGDPLQVDPPLLYLPIPADTAIARAGQLPQMADGEPWAEADILMPLSVIYACTGRLADARDAITRAQSVYGRPAAKIT